MRLPPTTVKLGGGQPPMLSSTPMLPHPRPPFITIDCVLCQPGCPPRAGAGEVSSSICAANESTLDTQLFTLAPAPSEDRVDALSCLTGGSAKCHDAAAVACFYQLAAAELDARVWLEYIEPPANISGGSSREGNAWRLSAEAVARGATVEDATLRALAQLRGEPLTSLQSVSRLLRTPVGRR